MTTGVWDYIVVGGGSGGCAAAGRLAERPGNRVLLIEAGPLDDHPLLPVPAMIRQVIFNPRFDWCYDVAPDASRGDRAGQWAAGRVLGGSSSINGMVYFRGLRSDFDHWAQLGAVGWSFDEVLPYFKRMETWLGAPGDTRGVGGPVRAGPPIYRHPLGDAVLAAARELGQDVVEDLNSGVSEGFGITQVNIDRGRRVSAAEAYLRRLPRRGTLQVITGAHARRLTFEGGRCVGVTYGRGGEERTALAGRGLVLACGAIGTPALLLRSGVGPADELAALGIPIAADNRQVGRNLQEHAGVRINARVKGRTLNSEQAPLRAAVHGVNWLLRGKGPVATSVVHVSGFLRSRPDLAAPDVQLQFVPFGTRRNAQGALEIPRDGRMGFTVNPCRPVSRGRVRLASADPDTRPVIDHQLIGAPEDVATLTAGGRFVRRLFATRALSGAILEETEPGPGCQSDQDWADFLRDNTFIQHHPAGACRMGSDDASVVDPQLRVRGVRGLWIADASVMPRVLSGNTNAASMMIGERAAAFILGETA